ncbi:hypothetical protein ARC78_15160 [Stenotrophomonas pictorum JCM 9942]|uniref:Peptidase S24/S26A/S26B/S26C domain-containing protein n=2 Tax=Stenotrophomonas pictorum TaxID=86184 RepID=A0A0R0A0W1_9GAMM|nr:hypothetical protein ARC78_15160 [Stenotrophomonas pictorum JCM 9942]
MMTSIVNSMFIDSGKRDVYAARMKNQLTDFQRRFEEAMAHAGVANNRAAFGVKLGLEGNQNQKLYNWFKRDQRVPDDQRRPLAALGISIDWLNNGDGEMFVDRTPTQVSPPATPGDYVRVEQLDATGGMGGAMVNEDHPEVIRSVEYGEAYIRALIGFVPPPGRLKLVSGTGDSMRPVIEPGEPTLMDSGVTTFQGDGIYWIGLGDRHDGHQIKMLQQRGDGLWVVSANPLYPPFPFPEHGRIGGRLYIRHKIERFN